MTFKFLTIALLLWYGVLIEFHPAVINGGEVDSLKKYELPDMVIVANKFESSTKDISTKVEILGEQEIKNINGSRLPDILKSAGSTYIKSYGLTPSLQTISINGLGAEHTLVLIDGVKINSFQNSQVDLSLVSKENIDHIEILGNGGSSLYGSEAIGGVINVITGKRDNERNSPLNFDASVSAGSFNTQRYSLSGYTGTKNFNLKLFYSSEKSDGNYEYYYKLPEKKELKEREHSGYYLYDIGINTQYIFNSFNTLHLISTYTYQDKEVPGVVSGTPSPLTNQKDRNWNNILKVENKLGSNMTLISSFNFQNNIQNYKVAPVLNSNYKTIVISGSPELHWKSGDNNIVGGLSISNGTLISNELSKKAIRNYQSAYISSGVMLLSGLRIFPSIRYDYISDIKKDVLTYRLGLNYQPYEEYGLSVKLNAGKSFRSPTFNDLYWKEWGNLSLHPESSINTEAGLFYSFQTPLDGQIEVTYTYIDAKDKIVWLPKGSFIWKPFNVAESHSNNISILGSLKHNINGFVNIGVNAGYNFINTVKTSESYKGDPETGKHFPYLPLETGKIGLMLEVYDAGVNLFYNYTGRRFQDFENKTSLAPVNAVDLNLSYGVKFYDISAIIKLEINNITNTEYETVAGYPMPLRNYLLTLSIKY